MPFLLAHDVHGAPIVAGADSQVAFVLHGILGNRNNWRTFARRLAAGLAASAGRPWSVVTVDQRHHGDSAVPPGSDPGRDSIAGCADDLAALADFLGVRPMMTVGHSFGGKVALCHADRHPDGLAEVWVLDSPPGPAAASRAEMDNEVLRVIQALRDVPTPLERREHIVRELLARGLPEPMALWMTTNLGQTAGGFEFRFNLEGAERMIADYFDWDGWPTLLRPRLAPRIEIVRAERSDRWDEPTLARLQALHGDVPTRLHVLPNAGHWLHADNPGGLLAMMLGS